MAAFGRPKGYRGSYKQWEEDGIAPQVGFGHLPLDPAAHPLPVTADSEKMKAGLPPQGRVARGGDAREARRRRHRIASLRALQRPQQLGDLRPPVERVQDSQEPGETPRPPVLLVAHHPLQPAAAERRHQDQEAPQDHAQVTRDRGSEKMKRGDRHRHRHRDRQPAAMARTTAHVAHDHQAAREADHQEEDAVRVHAASSGRAGGGGQVISGGQRACRVVRERRTRWTSATASRRGAGRSRRPPAEDLMAR